MSYCRWSSDGYRSDVYVYEHVDGSWTTHVAGRKKVGLDTLPPDPYATVSTSMDSEVWLEAYRAYHDAYEKLEFRDLPPPHAGETFKDDSPGDCANTLRKLCELGYHVPDGVIEALDEEAASSQLASKEL